MTGVNPAFIAENGRPVSTLWTCNGTCCYPAVAGQAQALGNVMARQIVDDAIARHHQDAA